MFRKILKKDLKRKKVMNVLLLLFITLTATLLGSSINMLTTNSSVVSKFMDTAKVADFTAITYTSKDNMDKATKWLTTSQNVKDYAVDTTLHFTKNDLKIPEGKGPFEYENGMMLQMAPKEKNLVFDEKDQPMTLSAGEIAIPYYISQLSDLVIGDKITITLEGRAKDFTITHYVKDAMMGSSMMGLKRWVVNEEDFNYLNTEQVNKFYILSVDTIENAPENVMFKEFSQVDILSMSNFDKNIIEKTYIMNAIIAGIIMIVSMLLILISFLMLRFTIGFTLQEDYKEIGIMKAIGIKNHSIQSIYMVKYLAIALIGGVIGYLLSLPLSATFININCGEMVTEARGWWNLPSFIGVVLVVLLTLAFCRLCTRKVNKFSAITAIRGGSTGERFHRIKSFRLNRSKTRPSTFLALSDLLQSGRKHIALFLSFVIGTMVLIITLNIVNTMKSPSLLELMGYADFDFTVDPPDTSDILYNYTTEEMLAYVDELEKDYVKKGIPVDLYPENNYLCKVYKDDPNDSRNAYTTKSYGIKAEEYKVEEGKAAELPNELSVTKVIADYFKVGVGDKLTVKRGTDTKEYIISGIFNCMMNMGEDIRLPQEATYELEGSTSLTIMGRYKGDASKEEYLKQLKEANPDLKVQEALDYVHSMLSGIMDTLDSLNGGILIIILCINFLVTTLVGRMMVNKEAPDIAVLKSLGYKNRSIRGWQMKRMTLLLLIAIFIGTIAANLLAQPIGSSIFSIMGASTMTPVVKPLEVFVLYPGILLACTLLATFVSTSDISRIKVWELNNQE